MRELKYAIVIAMIGLVIYLVRSARRREWPFAGQNRSGC